MALSKNAKLAGSGVAVIAVIALGLMLFSNDVSTDVVLRAGATAEAPCEIATKAPVVRVKRNNKLTWKIDNGTCRKNEAVMVGNFRRTDTPSSFGDCRNPKESGGVEWPFREAESDPSVRQRQGNKIELRVRPDVTLGANGEADYYYDICSGPNYDLKADPRLVIER